MFAFDIVSNGGKPLLSINYETCCSELLYVNLAFANIDFREGESIKNGVDESLLVFVSPNKLSLEIGTKYQLTIIN